MSTKTLNVLNGISHVLGTLAHDGAVDEDGEPIKIGLRREEGHPINDSRVMDGFSVKTSGDKLWICYHLETTLKELHAEAKFESNIKSTINDVKNFLQKEYKKATSRTLSLKEMEDPNIIVEYISRVRTSVYASQCYKVSGVDSECNDNPDGLEDMESGFKKFLDQGGWGKSPSLQNVSRKKEKSEPFNPAKMDSITK